MPTADARISADKLLARIETLGAIGATPEGGVRRLALSDADKAGRDQVMDWLRELGLEVHLDQVGNMFGLRAGLADRAPVMTGSHIDSVQNGGRLDGAYGVLAGLAVVEALNAAGVQTQRPIAVGVFTNEEGARFQPDMMGSLVHAGGLTLHQALDTTDASGARMGDELARIGYAGTMPCGSIRPHAFVEAHIEQGPVLEEDDVIIGAVEDLQGISWTEIRIRGQANHAGTTPMRLRHDAGYCVGAITDHVRTLTRETGGTQVGTVGCIELEPQVINVIPSAGRMTVDLRNTDETRLRGAEQSLERFLTELAASEGVGIHSERLARFEPVRFDPTIVQKIETHARRLGLSCQRMCSGAGHDAQMMARVCPSAMIFVPSAGGISHSPAERTRPEHLVAGADVLLGTLLELAGE